MHSIQAYPRHIVCILLGLNLAFIMNMAIAENAIYSYTDETGVIHFSNVPEHNKAYRLVLAVPSQHNIRASSHPFTTEVASAANSFGLDPALLHAVIKVESNHNPSAVSPKGAIGLMQLMPETSRRFGVSDPFDPEENIRAGARYLSLLLTTFEGDLTLALGAYNAGENAVIRHGRRLPPFPETCRYVTKVTALYRPGSPKPISTCPSAKF